MSRSKSAIFAVAYMMIWEGSARAFPAEGFYSAVELPALAREDGTRVSNLMDHAEVSRRILGNFFADRVVEGRWEDGSDLALFKGRRRVAFLRDASPYWGYATVHDLEVFEVEDPIDPEGSDQKKIYEFSLIKKANDRIMFYNCTCIKAMMSPPDAESSALAQQGLDPEPYLISKILSREGATIQNSKCVLWKGAPGVR